LKTGDLVEPSELFNGYHYSATTTRPDWVGVVTRIINENIKPELVEVSWSHGEIHRHYSDDLRLLIPEK
jgi:hypothetical protein